MEIAGKVHSAHDTDGQIVPPHLAVRAMRDSGYRNTAYALAELIDNSVQANATNVELICVEEYERVHERERRRLSTIGIMDDGDGMSPSTLHIALQFGNGTHLRDRAGIGRFGMGLPNSSISQCRRVEVWSWQNGPDNAYMTYLDVDEIESGDLVAVPAPRQAPVPAEWRGRTEILSSTGTLVIWKKFDEHRLSWKGAAATLRNTELLVGRMYRKFIDDGKLNVRLKAFAEQEETYSESARVNDPLYLMKNSSTPPPFSDTPMFQPWGESDEEFDISYNGEVHRVTVRMSWAKPETVPSDTSDRGARPYGKHAAKNLGVSVLREGRELDLDPNWANRYEPTERWWGVEVEFPSTLDEVFGVTNNKQGTTIFAGMAQYDWTDEAEAGESKSEFLERIKAEGDPRALLVPIVDHIAQQLKQIRLRLKEQTKGKRSPGERHAAEPGVEDLATSKFRERAEAGHEAQVDGEQFGAEESEELFKDLTGDKRYPDDVAREIADATLSRQRKVLFLTKAMDGYAFFGVEIKQGGLTEIVFNSNHPFYNKLIEVLEPSLMDETDRELVDRIHNASDTLRLLFAAWARYELEAGGDTRQLFDLRQDWGKMARFFLEEEGQS